MSIVDGPYGLVMNTSCVIVSSQGCQCLWWCASVTSQCLWQEQQGMQWMLLHQGNKGAVTKWQCLAQLSATEQCNILWVKQLTWGLNKMAAILQMTFSGNIFFFIILLSKLFRVPPPDKSSRCPTLLPSVLNNGPILAMTLSLNFQGQHSVCQFVKWGVGGAVRFLVVGTIGQGERPPRGQLWMEQCLTSLKYWPI